MGLQMRHAPLRKVRIITTLIAVFALVAQPLYGAVVRNVSAVGLSTVHATNLTGWDLSESRTAGHTELVSGGLHVWTTPSANGNYESKSAGYRAASFNLANTGDASIDFTNYSGTRPSLQLGVDKDGNGSWDGYLVYEPWAYGTGNWWSNKSFGIAAGGGYPSMGTISDYVNANPNAKVISIGYSLGSGVVGDAVISKLTAGGTEYTFSTPPPDTTGPSITNITPVNNARVAGTTQFSANVTDDSGVKKIAMYLRNQTGSNNEFALLKDSTSDKWYANVNTNNLAGNGTYDVVFRAVDNKNNVTYFNNRGGSFGVVVDNTNPSITVKSAPDTLGSLSAGIFSKAGFKLHDNDKVAKYSVNGATYSVSPNSWSDANNIAVGSRGGQYGQNTITLYDLANNHVSQTFILDNVAPTVTVKQNPATVGSGPYSKVSFALFDEYKIAKAEVNGTVINLSPNKWSDLNDIKIGSMGGLLGSNVVKVYDLAGNVTTVNFTLDSTPPNGTFTYSNNNGNAVTADDVTVTLNATEPIGTPDGWTKVNDTEFTKVYSANGKYQVEITDLAGNKKTLQYEVKRIDKVAPVINNIDDGGLYKGSVPYTVTEQNLSKILVDGQVVAFTQVEGHTYTAGPISGEGHHTVTAIDKANNSVAVGFTIDNSAPTLVMGTPTLNADGSYTAQVTTNDPASDVLFYLDGVLLSGATSNDDRTVWTVTTKPLNIGTTHTITASSTDGLGNGPREVSEGFTVPPVVSLPLANIAPTAIVGAGFATTFTQPLTQQTQAQPDDSAVLGAQTLKDSAGSDVAAIAATPQGWKIFGIAWYWILIAIVILASIVWWAVAAAKRRTAEDV